VVEPNYRFPVKEPLLVTGATGSVGSNVCRLAAEGGIRVKALVRDLHAAAPLEAMGVELVQGDVTDRDSLITAAHGVGTIIHGAAQIGGTWTTAKKGDFVALNQHGTFNVLDAAEANAVSDPAAMAEGQFGSMLKYLQTTYPEPPHDCTATTEELGVAPGSQEDGLRMTVEWLRDNGKI
jgi:nucleoside-diphosphate-sugar epimerase